MHSRIIITETITTRESQYHNTSITTTPHEQELKKEKSGKSRETKPEKENNEKEK